MHEMRPTNHAGVHRSEMLMLVLQSFSKVLSCGAFSSGLLAVTLVETVDATGSVN